MKAGTFRIALGFDQILDLIRQMPRKEKMRISKELEKEFIDAKLTSLLKTFRTDELDQKTIDSEAEVVRAQLYVGKKNK